MKKENVLIEVYHIINTFQDIRNYYSQKKNYKQKVKKFVGSLENFLEKDLSNNKIFKYFFRFYLFAKKVNLSQEEIKDYFTALFEFTKREVYPQELTSVYSVKKYNRWKKEKENKDNLKDKAENPNFLYLYYKSKKYIIEKYGSEDIVFNKKVKSFKTNKEIPLILKLIFEDNIISIYYLIINKKFKKVIKENKDYFSEKKLKKIWILREKIKNLILQL